MYLILFAIKIETSVHRIKKPKIPKNVMGLMKLLGGKADVLRGFTKRCNANYKVTPRMDIGLYLGDIQDHVVTMMTSLAHFEKKLSRSHTNSSNSPPIFSPISPLPISSPKIGSS